MMDDVRQSGGLNGASPSYPFVLHMVNCFTDAASSPPPPPPPSALVSSKIGKLAALCPDDSVSLVLRKSLSAAADDEKFALSDTNKVHLLYCDAMRAIGSKIQAKNR